MRALFGFGFGFAIVLSFAPLLAATVQSQTSIHAPIAPPRPRLSTQRHHTPPPQQQSQPSPVAEAGPPARTGDLIAEVTLADIGFVNGLRFANLGGHHDLFVPLPQDADVVASELVLALDDVTAYDARRHLEVQVNDRTVAAIALDGKSHGRIVHVPLARSRPKDGFLKLSFLYSGAVSPDRCIDVRYVGDSVIVRPETAVEVDVGPVAALDVASTARLMPRDVAVVLPSRRVTANEIASAVTVARSLIASGRRVSFYHGFDALKDLAKRDEAGRWTRGIVLVGPLDEAAGYIDLPAGQDRRCRPVIRHVGRRSRRRIAGIARLRQQCGERRPPVR